MEFFQSIHPEAPISQSTSRRWIYLISSTSLGNCCNMSSWRHVDAVCCKHRKSLPALFWSMPSSSCLVYVKHLHDSTCDTIYEIFPLRSLIPCLKSDLISSRQLSFPKAGNYAVRLIFANTVHTWLLGFSLRGLVDSNFLCRTRNDSLLLPPEAASSETNCLGDGEAVSSTELSFQALSTQPLQGPGRVCSEIVVRNAVVEVNSGGKDVNIYFKWSILWKWRDRMDAKAPPMSETFWPRNKTRKV